MSFCRQLRPIACFFALSFPIRMAGYNLNMDAPVTSESRGRYWLRVLRPIQWWLLLVLILFGIRTHQRLIAGTVLKFTVSLSGKQSLFLGATATLDGKPAESGMLISLGKHEFIVQHPKGELFRTNLSIWYGEHDLGTIDLKRTTGMLAVEAAPPANTITIQGPEFSLTLTNAPGVTSSVPTDQYVVTAHYRHTRLTREVVVSPNLTATASMHPQFGALHLTCNQTNAAFQVVRNDGQQLEIGEFPSTLVDVPEGKYKLVAIHRQNRDEREIEVKMGITNELDVHFSYGTIEIETEPSGATIRTENGRELGTTPFRITELKFGSLNLVAALNGFEPVPLSIAVLPDQTVKLHTNLVSINYVKALSDARGFVSNGDYENAVRAATAALEAKADDPDANAVLQLAYGKRELARARGYAERRDYAGGIKELENALRLMPKNEDIITQLADLRNREQEQREQRRQERLERPKRVFEALESRFADAPLFTSHDLKTEMAWKDVRAAIVKALQTQPAFQILRNESRTPETFEIEAQQDTMTALATIASRRKCIIVGGQTRDTESQVFFKVLEYKTEAVEKFSIGNWIGTPADVRFIPVSSSRIQNMTEKLQAQLNFGVSNVTARISLAVAAGKQ